MTTVKLPAAQEQQHLLEPATEAEPSPSPRRATAAEKKQAPRTVTQETPAGNGPKPRLIFTSPHDGRIYRGDSLRLLRDQTIVGPGTVNLIMTSPPFGLVRKKEYGNVDAAQYVNWFKKFGKAFHNALADNGSLVLDIGGAWNAGQPTRSLYHFKLLIMLCEQIGFHLAQEFYWWNPSRLPTPAEWVTVRRVRVKDAVNCVWWLSKTPWPKASNLRVLQPYSPSMKELLVKGYKAKLRPSGHDISTKFNVDNGASIPPNLLSIANTESNSAYLRYCDDHHLPVHPARYPAALPEYFIRMLTDPGDLVMDPFAGSCITGEVAERLGRSWICCELREDYVTGALGRFEPQNGIHLGHNGLGGNNRVRAVVQPPLFNAELPMIVDMQIEEESDKFYKLPRPGLLWNGVDAMPLPADGGQTRPTVVQNGDVADAADINGDGEDPQ